MSATPTPWKVEHATNEVVIESADGNWRVCEIDASYESDEAAASAHDDGDLIVLAVNCHGTFKEALTEILSHIEDANTPYEAFAVAAAARKALDYERQQREKADGFKSRPVGGQT